MLKNFIYLGLLMKFSIQAKILAFQPITENNHVLVGHVFQQLYARDWFSCIQACHREPKCISYNYERSAGASSLCELNICGVESLCDRDRSLIYSMGFVFQQIRESKDKKICTLAENKSKTKQSSVQGSWSHYGAWRECSASCGGGIRRRTRTCITAFCVGNTEETGNCNVHSCDGPSTPPQFVRAVTKTMYSISVKWDEVTQSLPNGDIRSYTISYHSDKTPESKQRKVFNAPTWFANLTHLTKNTNYTITVLASNEKGNGPASVPIVAATSDGSVFQCPLEPGDFWLKDPNSCFRYYRCYNNGHSVHHGDCPSGTEFKPSAVGSPCNHPSKPYCHV